MPKFDPESRFACDRDASAVQSSRSFTARMERIENSAGMVKQQKTEFKSGRRYIIKIQRNRQAVLIRWAPSVPP